MKNKTIISITIFLLNIGLYSTDASAHQLSTSYFNAKLTHEGDLLGEFQIRLIDLQRSIGLDSNNDGNLTWQETKNKNREIKNWLSNVLIVTGNQNNCQLTFPGKIKIDSHINEKYLVIPITAICQNTRDLALYYNGLFNIDKNHKLLINIEGETKSHTRVISLKNNKINILSSSYSDTFNEFVVQGVIHIWIGIDHILFLIVLLFGCFLYENNTRTKKRNNKQLFIEILKIVSVFTLAHSITLSFSALGWINFSSRWVEVGIAITVLIAAINNLISLYTRILVTTFLFGLLHGMGFASVLVELGLPDNQQFLTILAFNVGVELGQICVIIVIFPLLIMIKKHIVYSQQILKISSMFIAIISCIWIYERIIY